MNTEQPVTRESRTLPAGTVLHLRGIPIRLDADAEFSTYPENWSWAQPKSLQTKEAE